MHRRTIVAGLTAAAMAACSYPVPDDTSGQDPGALDPNIPGLRIAKPSDGARVSDLVDLEIQTSKLAELRSGLRFQMDDQEPVVYDAEVGLPSSLALDTSLYANGSHRVTVSVDTADGKTLAHTINLRFDNLPFRIASYRAEPFAQNGSEAVVDLSLEGNTEGLALAADFSSLDSAYQPGAEIVEPLSEGVYRIRYPVSPANALEDGPKSVVITAKGSSESLAIVRQIPLPLRNTPPAPFEIKGAIFVDEPAPAPQSGAPDVLSVLDAESLHLIGDEPGTFRVSWARSAVPLERLILTFTGYAGYYILPVDSTKTEATIDVVLPEGAPTATPAQALQQPQRKALRARNSLQLMAPSSSPLSSVLNFFGIGGGSTSSTTSSNNIQVNTTPIPPSVAKVTLKWSGAADLDLRLTEPGPFGQVISYGNPVSSASGGKLSLDSNAHCVKAPNPAETISWPEGTGPMSGTYKVQVTMFEGCSNDPDKKLTSAVSYSGEYTDCQGNTHPFSGTFPAGTAQNTSVNVATYDLQCPTWLHGWVSVERKMPPSLAMSSVSVPRTKIRALKSSDNSELATGYTNQNGMYKLAFDSHGAKFYLQTEGEIIPTFAKLQINDNSGNRQFWKGPELDPKNLPGTYNLAIKDAPGATRRAGAFRLIQNVQNGIIWASRATGKDFNQCGRPDCLLKVRWEPAAAMTHPGSWYWWPEQTIQIAANDENSPFTVLHEYFHYVMATWSKDNTMGGDHWIELRSAPTLAWSEGAATYYAFRTMGVDTVYWGAPDGSPMVSRRNYDTNIPPAQGTDPANSQVGKLSEGMVTQMLWELSQKTGLIDAAIFQKIPTRFSSQQFGFATPDPLLGADFIDFIDGLRGLDGAPSDAELGTLLQGPPAGHPEAAHHMPYDFVNNTKI